MAIQNLHPSKKKRTRRGDRTRPASAGRYSGASRSKPNQSGFDNSAQPKRNFDRYNALALAAAAAGDAIEAENYYQHAEHYYRLMKQKAA